MADEIGKIYHVLMKNIRGVSSLNVRHMDINKDLEELASSINEHGLIQPVELLGECGNPPYELIVGQRRFLAHKLLGKRHIRAVFAGNITEIDAKLRSLAENMHRSELSYEDAANAITELYKRYNRDDKKVARRIGMSLRTVRQYIYIEERASEEVKKQLRGKKVKPVDVKRSLNAAAGDSKKAENLLKKIVNYTTYQKIRAVGYGQSHPKASVKEIDQEAKRIIVEASIMVNIPEEVRKGLERASEILSMGPEEIAAHAIQDWLYKKGFIKSE